MPYPSFGPYEYREGNLAVEWEFIGEGLSGDYDEMDPKDVPLLRANLLYYHPTNTVPEGEEPWTFEDGSYCTLADTRTPRELLDESSRILLARVRSHGNVQIDDEWGGCHFNRRLMEVWTWVEYNGTSITPPKNEGYWR